MGLSVMYVHAHNVPSHEKCLLLIMIAECQMKILLELVCIPLHIYPLEMVMSGGLNLKMFNIRNDGYGSLHRTLRDKVICCLLLNCLRVDDIKFMRRCIRMLLVRKYRSSCVSLEENHQRTLSEPHECLLQLPSLFLIIVK